MTLKNILFLKIFEITCFFILTLIFINCHKTVLEPISYQNVAPELCPYFQQFEIEAAARGVEIDLKTANISGRIVPIRSGEVGACATTEDQQVLIDQGFWERSSELSKELIVFHELGHCFLKRNHLNTRADNGTCSSIMRNGKGGCIDFYTSKTRDKLLDELFQ